MITTSFLVQGFINIIMLTNKSIYVHSKKVFITLTYSLSFEIRHDSRCSVYRIPTYTNGSKAIIGVSVSKPHTSGFNAAFSCCMDDFGHCT